MTHTILRPGDNVWRTAHAERAAVLCETASYFDAFYEAAQRARRSLLITGWEFHTRMLLRRGTDEEVGLLAFLEALTDARPELTIRVLIWESAALYALEREIFQEAKIDLQTSDQIRFHEDERPPTGASTHQKLVIVDDELAFVGGVDLTMRRWDTAEHAPDDARRTDPRGQAYGPFHDVQAVVDAEAARALGDVARRQWHAATGEAVDPVAGDAATGEAGDADRWPASVMPDFEDVEVGIARTVPKWEAGQERREVERLYLDSITAAERTIYIENQYVSNDAIGDALIDRLGEPDGPEVVLVGPEKGHAWPEKMTMSVLRARLFERMRQADAHDRLRIVYPVVGRDAAPTPVFVHAKLCIIDDRLVRVGSANLTNRSMGFDTECDIAIEATDDTTRRSVASLRDRLLAGYLGLEPAAVAERIDAEGLVALVDASCRSDWGPRGFASIRPDPPDWAERQIPERALFDPEQPLDEREVAAELLPADDGSGYPYLRVSLSLLVLVGAALVWRWTGADWPIGPAQAADFAQQLAESPGAGPLVVAAVAIAATVGLPISVLIVVCGLVFGMGMGLVWGFAGALVSACIGFGLGRTVYRRSDRPLEGERHRWLRPWLDRRPVWSTLVVRVVSVAPFALLNLIAGDSQLRFKDYLLATAVGMAPGVALMALFGDLLGDLLGEVEVGTVAVLVAIAAALAIGGGVLSRFMPHRPATEQAASHQGDDAAGRPPNRLQEERAS